MSNHYYYGDYRKSTKYPWPRRNINEDLQGLQAIEDEERKTVAQEMAKEAEFTGLSILHRLYALYGFDYRKHCVFDVMHSVVLGVVKKHLTSLKITLSIEKHFKIDFLMCPGLLNLFPFVFFFSLSKTLLLGA